MAVSPHYFIGIPLKEEIKQTVLDWQLHLKKELEDNYQIWTNKEDFHITLKFLGEVEAKKISDLKKELNKLKELKTFQITIKEIGTFGQPRKPRVLWAGVEDNQELHIWKDQVEKVCMNVGFPEDNQPFRPHVTLAKKWKGDKLSKEKFNQLVGELQTNREMNVDSFSLFRIHPSKRPKYEEVMKIQMK